MAIYLRPRRGKKSTAESQNIILKRGEIFFESPETGVGTGAGKIKIGDGTTAYNNLPYFLEPTLVDVANATITFTEASSGVPATLLSALTSGAKLNYIIGIIKKLLTLYNTSITNLQTSFQNGCSTIANAITANGVSTATNASPSTMATNISTVATNKYNAGVTATKVGTAVATNVLAGKTFTNSSGVGLSGTMIDRGAWTNTPTTSGNITIPAGYHNGSGYINTTTVYNNGYNTGAASGKKYVKVNNVAKTLQSGYNLQYFTPGDQWGSYPAGGTLFIIPWSAITGGQWTPSLVRVTATATGYKYEAVITSTAKFSFLYCSMYNNISNISSIYTNSYLTSISPADTPGFYNSIQLFLSNGFLFPFPRPSDGFTFDVEAWA